MQGLISLNRQQECGHCLKIIYRTLVSDDQQTNYVKDRWWPGLVVACWSQSSYSKPGLVSTWIDDRLWAGKPSGNETSHLGQLSLPSLRGR